MGNNAFGPNADETSAFPALIGRGTPDRLFGQAVPKGENVTPNILRVFGFLFLVSAAVVAILNLHRVANLGLPWVAPLLLIFGAACMVLSRRGES